MRHTFEDLVAVMARLRGPDGCPWDREQTHASLAPYLLEEAHETLEAISRGDSAALCDELGDLLLQVVFHGQMAKETGAFDAGDIVDGLVRKLISRHPHVFGGTALGTPGEVLAQWHEIKRREAPQRGVFDGIPASLPALARAQKIVERAARQGEENAEPDFRLALEGVRQALDATTVGAAPADATSAEQVPSELVEELLLSVVALAQAAGVDAETTLRAACDRFLEKNEFRGERP
ncbi:MAG: nucleoside triphosphate pyrophosphohydrolase [Armatimonadetes bacterium]|nr:nucleoside triphosphate pyrophosphohydrolase [Armatimonadota bacterium]